MNSKFLAEEAVYLSLSVDILGVAVRTSHEYINKQFVGRALHFPPVIKKEVIL